MKVHHNNEREKINYVKNIFVEGIQGSGKTTLQNRLGQQLPNYRVFREGDYSPIELAWCSYMTEAEYQKALLQFPDLKKEIEKRTTKEGNFYIVEYTRILAERREFYQYMEVYEIYNGRKNFEEFRSIIQERYKKFSGEGNIFECSFFQNIMEELLLYYLMSEQEILDFYKDLFALVEEKEFCMLYLYSDDIERDVLQIKEERSDAGVEMWYPLMLNYLKETPYGKEHPFEGISDMVAHFIRRRKMEQKVIDTVLKEKAIIVPAKQYDIEELVRKIG